MKYVCEVCGCKFDDINKCREHEGPCIAANERKMYIKNTLNDLVEIARYEKVRLGAEIRQEDGSVKWYDLESADFQFAKNTIQMNLKMPEEVADVGKTKSGTKKVK